MYAAVTTHVDANVLCRWQDIASYIFRGTLPEKNTL
jgi:hypothetical protein